MPNANSPNRPGSGVRNPQSNPAASPSQEDLSGYKAGDYYSDGRGFYVFDGTSFKWRGRSRGSGNEVSNPRTRGANSDTGLGKGLDQATAESGAGSLRYPRNIGEDQGDFVLFQFYDYQPPFRKQASTNYNQASDFSTKASGYKDIILYMPEDISSGFRANWAGKSMSTFTADGLRALGRDGLDKIPGVADAVKGLIDRGGALAGAAAIQSATQRLTGDSLSYDDIFGSISGSILNPNTELLFSAIDLRNFSLNFKLVPRNQPEATDINAIIKQFLKANLPSATPGVGGSGSVFEIQGKGVTAGFIGVPKLIKVSFMHKGKEHDILPRYKMCALVQVEVNYTPDGSYATYNNANGQPVAMGLSLNFQETKICFAEDIDNNSVR